MKRVRKPKTNLFDKVQESVRAIRRQTKLIPEVAVIFGTGLGDISKKIKLDAKMNYSAIPHFPVSTAESHAGNLLFRPRFSFKEKGGPLGSSKGCKQPSTAKQAALLEMPGLILQTFNRI